MALAAQPQQLHFPPQSKSHEPSWDEAIVPALRQRLVNESQMLTKRLSTHSISANAAADIANSTVVAGGFTSKPSSHQHNQSSGYTPPPDNNNNGGSNNNANGGGKPSAIPRPSSEATPTKKRQRTNSTPFSSIPIPITVVDRPTRIPKVAAKANGGGGSISSHGHHPYRPSNLGAGSLNGSGSVASRGAKTAKGRVGEGYMEPPSPSSFSLDQRSDSGSYRGGGRNGNLSLGAGGGRNYIPNEEAPFMPNSASTSTEFHYEQTRLMHSPNLQPTRGAHGRYATTGSSSVGHSQRPSVDEEGEEGPSLGDAGEVSGGEPERPFEHWYRGEAARNGGVGELKIGKAEMLDIAQFGHTGAAAKATKNISNPGYGTLGGFRRRAGSFDGKRESWIPMEMEEAAYGMGKVIDESPLTDLEADEYTTEGERTPYPYPGINGHPVPAPMPRVATRGGSKEEYTYDDEDTTMVMSTTPTGITPVPAGPYSSRRGTITNGTPISSRTASGATAKQQGSTSSTGGSKIPLGNNNSAVGAGSKSSLLGKPPGKKGKGKSGIPKQRSRNLGADTSAQQQQQDAGDGEDGEELDVEKIPFRNPPTKGNWDDIVLPAVTKKMGIEGYGLKSEEGNILEVSEEVRKRMSAIQPMPPVPGLFGYDTSKYRPARPEEDIHMAELGVSQPSPPGTPKQSPKSTSTTLPPFSSTGRDSPLAFSHYQEHLPPISEKNARRGKRESGAPLQPPAITVSPPSAEDLARRRREMEKEEKGAGCCGCVVM